MNSYTKNLLTETAVCIVAFAIIAGIFTLCFHSCTGDDSTSSSAEKTTKNQNRIKEEKLDEFLYVPDEYIYEDKNGVFHADIECTVMDLGYLSAHDNPSALYSVRRYSKSRINDWDYFACTHHLCIKCFGNGVLNALKKEQKKDSINVTPY